MTNEEIKKTILNAYKGAIQFSDAIRLISHYIFIVKGKENHTIIDFLAQNPSNPFAQQMLNSAFDISKSYFENNTVTITKLFSKENTLLMVY